MIASLRPAVATARFIASRSFSSSPTHSLARMQVIGRLAETPESTATSTGRELIKYTLGVSNGQKNSEGERATSWFKIASFVEGPQRDYLLSLPKGTLLHVDADARMDTFQNAEGIKQSRLNLVQRTMEMLSRPRNAETDVNAAEVPSSGLGAS